MKIYRIAEEIEEVKEIEKVAAVIVMYEGRVLILKRGSSAPWMPNVWNLPGGEVEEGEDLASAAMRECAEEAGISVALKGEVSIHNDPEFELHIFKGTTNSDQVTINFESSAYAWVGKEDFWQYDYVPYIQGAIASAFQ